MTALFKNQQQENLPARDRRDWNEIESLGELHRLIASDGYAASFQDMGQYRSALVCHMGTVLWKLAAGQSTVRAWRERMGKPANWPLHAPTDVERAMVAEIAELRAQQAAAPGLAKPELMRQAVASVVSRAGDDLRIAWLRPERCDVGTLLYCAVEQAAPSALGTPEAPKPTCMTDEQAERWAWKQVKLDVGTDGWTAGESCNYFGFFLWGWRYRAQYERQRAAQLDGVQGEKP